MWLVFVVNPALAGKSLVARVLTATFEAMPGPVMLLIRDGWGINPGGRERREENGDATLLAGTPFHDQLYQKYPTG